MSAVKTVLIMHKEKCVAGIEKKEGSIPVLVYRELFPVYVKLMPDLPNPYKNIFEYSSECLSAIVNLIDLLLENNEDLLRHKFLNL